MNNDQPNLTRHTDSRALFSTLLPQVQAAVQRACQSYRHRATPDEVDDLTQQLLLRLLEQDARRLRSYDPLKAAFSTWLDAVARHHLSNHLHRQKHLESWEHLAPEELIYPPLQEATLLAAERREVLQRAMSKLPAREQQILGLCFSAEVAAIDIAALIGMSVGLVYKHKHYGMVKLRKELAG